MKRAEEMRIRASLIQILDAWWEGPAQQLNVSMPVTGDSTLVHMAEAALGVLLSVDDLYEFLRDSGKLKEGWE